MKLNELKPQKGAVKRKKRVGRGDASGHGGTSCRGTKGQNARSGSSRAVGFEGGQMPLLRRLPKRGFTNIFSKKYIPVNLERLAGLSEATEVTLELLLEKGIVKGNVGKPHSRYHGVKILGRGEAPSGLVIKGCKVSKSARKKIEQKGGRVEVG